MTGARTLSKLFPQIVGFLALFTLAAALPVSAQMRGRGGSFHSPGGRPTVHAAGRIGTPLNPNFAPLYGVPGLGFDYEHLAAISPAFRGRHGFRRPSGRTFLTPIFDFGFPYYYAFDTGEPYDVSPDLQAPPATLQPAVPSGSEAPVESEPPAIEEAPPPPVEPAAPPPELGQLILVRRDGQIVMAVAFTTSGGRLTYITQDGLRRSFPVSELDADATRQMNDVNGTNVSLPN